MGGESPNAKDSKSMIGFVPSAQQLTLQSSKVQNWQHWGQLLGGSLSTFLIALGEIFSIFIYIFGFHWKIWPIMMFGLHFGLGYFCIKCRKRGGWNGGQTSWSVSWSADQIWWWIIVVMVHIHHSQPLKMKFGTNHFLGSETFVPIQYREGVKTYL